MRSETRAARRDADASNRSVPGGDAPSHFSVGGYGCGAHSVFTATEEWRRRTAAPASSRRALRASRRTADRSGATALSSLWKHQPARPSILRHLRASAHPPVPAPSRPEQAPATAFDTPPEPRTRSQRGRHHRPVAHRGRRSGTRALDFRTGRGTPHCTSPRGGCRGRADFCPAAPLPTLPRRFGARCKVLPLLRRLADRCAGRPSRSPPEAKPLRSASSARCAVAPPRPSIRPF
jgi:hypothetical protein